MSNVSVPRSGKALEVLSQEIGENIQKMSYALKEIIEPPLNLPQEISYTQETVDEMSIALAVASFIVGSKRNFLSYVCLHLAHGFGA